MPIRNVIYNKADGMRVPVKIWASIIDNDTIGQAVDLARLPFAYKNIALMPDAHVGYGMPIGGVLATVDGVFIPNAVGVDIGCGMRWILTNIPADSVDTKQIKHIVDKIYERVPVGFASHEHDKSWPGFIDAPDVKPIVDNIAVARRQLGTLGGGNHFIEIQVSNSGKLCVMIHSGSRRIGLKVAKYYHTIAQRLNEKWYANIPNKDLAFLPVSTKEGKEYKSAMEWCLQYARANRAAMMDAVKDSIYEVIGAFYEDGYLDVHHNYAAFERHGTKNVVVHRKGATAALSGRFGIIPGSQGTSSFIVKGKGNPDSFNSCSHGAGRAMGRNEAKRKLSLSDERARMKGIVHRMNTVDALEEAPSAYKDISVVMQDQSDLVEISTTLMPLGVVKG